MSETFKRGQCVTGLWRVPLEEAEETGRDQIVLKCYGVIAVSPPNSYTEALTLRVYGDEGFGR